MNVCRLSHSCTLLKLLDGMRGHLAGTFLCSGVDRKFFRGEQIQRVFPFPSFPLPLPLFPPSPPLSLPSLPLEVGPLKSS